jgi:hypothetical protein
MGRKRKKKFGGKEKLRRRRLKLFKENPHCFWCGRKTIYARVKDGDKQPPNLATIDHLVHRLDPDRAEKLLKPGPKTVLACEQCNFRRGTGDERHFLSLNK